MKIDSARCSRSTTRPGSSSSRAALHELGVELVSSGGTATAIADGRHPGDDGRRRHRRARDARPPGGDAAPEDPRRHPRRPRQGVAPRRHRRATASSRSTSSCRTSTRSSSDPTIETDRHRRPGDGARGGEEPRVGRRSSPSPDQYDAVLDELRANDGAVGDDDAARARARGVRRTRPRTTPRSSQWLRAVTSRCPRTSCSRSTAPTRRCATARTRTSTRARYRAARHARAGGTACTQHSGLALSYLNFYDADAAWQLVHDLGDRPACAIIKHANPCGVARRRRPRRPRTSARSSATSAPRSAGSSR